MAGRFDRTPARASAAADDSPLSLLRTLVRIAQDVPGLVSNRVHLLTLELRRAKSALAQIVGLLVAAAILAFTAWLALWAGLMVAALSWGVDWLWVVFGVIALNLGAAVLALLRARSLGALLALPATVRHLTLAQASAESAKRASTEVAPR